ncbi:MAG: EscC/YscC/HrcC family type III secretion system outer membrane ring protein [Burkholderiales bacterium RIFCSPLOWO2_02_FULL_57_36]|nr:MAG: EscC/YscC/HrcC family type III secretion system outer membrane ring protein [Burkholderiales bacterium RIFCSPLOWO2_02_FULL_57_36]
MSDSAIAGNRAADYWRTMRWLKVLMIALSVLFAANAQALTPPGWKDSGFSINADGMTLREVLNEFGLTYGVRVTINVKNNNVLKGRVKADTGSDFLDRLMHSYDFRWFVYDGTLYIVPRNDSTSARLEVGEDAVQDAKAAMIGVGLFDSRFGWGELPDEGVVLINGPREYVNLAREVLMPEKKAPVPKGKQLMVFRLKYASATDRVINIRGQTETIAGLKTILTGLIGSEPAEKSTDDHGKFDASSEKRSRTEKNGRGSAYETSSNARASTRSRNDRDESDEQNSQSRSRKSVRADRPRIDADASLNAIIVYDNGNKREMYQSFITELDIEPQQIEIEALIVDIDRNKLTDLGVEWGIKSGNKAVQVNAGTSDSQGVDLPIPGATMLISNAARFYARLKAMESNGEAHVLAKPTVLTLDNVAAVLDLSQTAFVPLVGERVAELANVTVGTMLRVVPRVVREGSNIRVRLEVDIEDGALGDAVLKSTVTRSTISTQAIIDLQQTLMIGGYHSESTSTNLQKVPVLGDVPLFGGLFRSTTESQSRRERLFLITPRLSGSTGVKASERSKAGRVAHDAATANNQRSGNQPQRPAPSINDNVNAESTLGNE